MRRAKLLSASTLEAKLEFGAQEYSITDFLHGDCPASPQVHPHSSRHLLGQAASYTHTQADPPKA